MTLTCLRGGVAAGPCFVVNLSRLVKDFEHKRSLSRHVNGQEGDGLLILGSLLNGRVATVSLTRDTADERVLAEHAACRSSLFSTAIISTALRSLPSLQQYQQCLDAEKVERSVHYILF